MFNYGLAEVQDFVKSIYASADYPNPRLYVAPYAYPVSITGLAQNQSQTTTLNITGNADFLLMDVKYRASIGAAETVSNKIAAFVRMLAVDSGTNEQFTNAAVDLENYAQNGVGDRSLPFPRLLQGRTSISLTFTNWAPTAETYAFDVLFNGLQIKKVNDGLPAQIAPVARR